MLYLDLLKLFGGFCVLGALISIPSYALSAAHASGVYSASTLEVYPNFFVRLAVGSRTACTSEACAIGNLVSAILEAMYTVLLFAGVRAFRVRVDRLARVNEANNVYVREFAIQLHGVPRDVTPQQARLLPSEPAPSTYHLEHALVPESLPVPPRHSRTHNGISARARKLSPQPQPPSSSHAPSLSPSPPPRFGTTSRRLFASRRLSPPNSARYRIHDQ